MGARKIMSKKVIGLVVAIVVLAGLAGGGYALFSSPSKAKTSGSVNSYNSSSYGTSSSSSHQPSNTTSPVNNSVLITKTNSNVGGQYLASPNGMTLYTYSSDTSNTSNCTGACLSIWPAYVDSGSTTGLPANVGTIKRTDNGEIQYTYKGMPLYFYIGDKAPGQINGNGVQGFYVAKP